jgi:hypothetical protein
MAIIVAVIGGVTAALGLTGVLYPQVMRQFAARFRDPPGMYIASAVRLVLGALLIWAGPACRPESPWVGVAVRLFGVLIVVSAGVILLAGAERFRAIIDWSLTKSPGFLRGWSAVAVVLGALLLLAGL